MARAAANLDYERSLVEPGALIIGVDEVGRGALAGPVCVGAVLIDPYACEPPPTGLTDSKLLTPTARAALLPVIEQWCLACAVGFASAAEIDAVGIIGALRRAAERAISSVVESSGIQQTPLVLLDGKHDWLSRPHILLDVEQTPVRMDPAPEHDQQVAPAARVVTEVKADVSCASVAAASVLAKETRDSHVTALAKSFPHYGWDGNKGYAAAAHREALLAHGVTEEHRWSWNLLGESAAASE